MNKNLSSNKSRSKMKNQKKRTLRKKKNDEIIGDNAVLSEMEMTINDIQEIQLDKRKSAVKQLKKEISDNGQKHSHASPLTIPENIMFDILVDVYNIDKDQDKFKDFTSKLVQSLSLLSTIGNDRYSFGRDFNDMYRTFVTTINLCERFRKKLDENGIEYDISSMIEDIFNGKDDDLR